MRVRVNLRRLLDVTPDAQATRLARRGDDPPLLPHHQAFAEWMRGHARDPRHMPHLLSTNGWEAMRWDRWSGIDTKQLWHRGAGTIVIQAGAGRRALSSNPASTAESLTYIEGGAAQAELEIAQLVDLLADHEPARLANRRRDAHPLSVAQSSSRFARALLDLTHA